MINDIVIIGAGGAGKAVARIVEDINALGKKWNLLGFLDDNEKLHNKNYYGEKVFSDSRWLLRNKDVFAVVAIGKTIHRMNVFSTLLDQGYSNFATLIHPSFIHHHSIKIGKGTIIYHGVSIDPDVIIHENVLVNKGVSIGHDTVINNNSVISPNVSIGGNVTIGDSSFLGMNSCIIQGLQTGKNSTIGAGAVILNNIPKNTLCVGNPGIIKKTNGNYPHP